MRKHTRPVVGQDYYGKKILAEKSVYEKRKKAKIKRYLVQCACGKRRWALEHNLRATKTSFCSSCAPSRTRKSYPSPKEGEVYAGKFLILRKAHRNAHGKQLWLSKCTECEKDMLLIASQMQYCKTSTCLKCSSARLGGHRPSLGIATAVNRKWDNVRNGAEARGHEFCLTKEDVTELVLSPCFYCGEFHTWTNPRTNETFDINGIDRLDNSLGYRKENCVPACWTCNKLKGTFSPQTFLEKIAKILSRHEHKK